MEQLEHSEENVNKVTTPKLLNCRYRSIKYKQEYEVFYSEKLIEGLRRLDNRALTGALTQIKKIGEKEATDETPH